MRIPASPLHCLVLPAIALLLAGIPALSQTAQTAAVTAPVVPQMMKYNGVAADRARDTVEAVFRIYASAEGGEALWSETQRVAVDAEGKYTVLLGAAAESGLPQSVFAGGQARWLGVSIERGPEQPRVPLASVAYAMKAADAETLAGLPAADFVTQEQLRSVNPPAPGPHTPVATRSAVHPNGTPTGSGTANTIPLWTGSSSLGNSALTQSGSNISAAGGMTVQGGGTFGVNGTAANGVTGTGSNTGVYGTGTVSGVYGLTNSTTQSDAGVRGFASAATAMVYGVTGGTKSTAQNSAGVYGVEAATTGQVFGVEGQSFSTTPAATGVEGWEAATTGAVFGVSGGTNSTTAKAAGVSGFEGGATGQVYGVYGYAGSNTASASGVYGFEGAATGAVSGVSGSTSSNQGSGVAGNEWSTTGAVSGVNGYAMSTTLNAAGVSGWENAATGLVFGVSGATLSTGGAVAPYGFQGAAGVNGWEGNATAPLVAGVRGSALSTGTGATGVYGWEYAKTGQVYGVSGQADSVGPRAAGVFGTATATTGANVGVIGVSASTGGSGVYGKATATTGGTAGVYGASYSSTGSGVVGVAEGSGGTAGTFMSPTSTGTVIEGRSGAGNTKIFGVDPKGNGTFAGGGTFGSNVTVSGNLTITGKLVKGSGSFKIDDPLDPANKYLSHSFVESPDMMNVYNGNIVTDRHGMATVMLPDYFEALNRDFRYQLTVIGQFAQAIVAKEIDRNHFVIRTSRPGVKVSWQVTGIRQDAYANSDRIPVEEDKPAGERGYYLHPEAFGLPASQSVAAASKPTASLGQVSSR